MISNRTKNESLSNKSSVSSVANSNRSQLKHEPNSQSITSGTGSKSGKLKTSFHIKNQLSDAPLVQKTYRSDTVEPNDYPPTGMKLRARHRTILPMSSDVGGGSKTPDGFDIKKFIEENEKKMNEATRKIEGKFLVYVLVSLWMYRGHGIRYQLRF